MTQITNRILEKAKIELRRIVKDVTQYITVLLKIGMNTATGMHAIPSVTGFLHTSVYFPPNSLSMHRCLKNIVLLPNMADLTLNLILTLIKKEDNLAI